MIHDLMYRITGNLIGQYFFAYLREKVWSTQIEYANILILCKKNPVKHFIKVLIVNFEFKFKSYGSSIAQKRDSLQFV